MMDHSLRTISYIADIGDILVLYTLLILVILWFYSHVFCIFFTRKS